MNMSSQYLKHTNRCFLQVYTCFISKSFSNLFPKWRTTIVPIAVTEICKQWFPLKVKLFFVRTASKNFLKVWFDGLTFLLGLAFWKVSKVDFNPKSIGMLGYRAASSSPNLFINIRKFDIRLDIPNCRVKKWPQIYFSFCVFWGTDTGQAFCKFYQLDISLLIHVFPHAGLTTPPKAEPAYDASQFGSIIFELGYNKLSGALLYQCDTCILCISCHLIFSIF